MFTGLIAELGEMASIDRKAEGAVLSVKVRGLIGDAAIGDSIAVNGVCLTCVRIGRETLSFDVSFETLKSTNLGSLSRGDRVNLEPSLRPSSKLGGHFVTGHVDGIGIMRSRSTRGNATRIEIQAPAEVLRYLVAKGSVAVDGISLTVVDVMRDGFSVVIIPHTGQMTTIGFKREGDTVNLEPDILAKYVEKLLRAERRPFDGQQGQGDEPAVSGDPLLAALRKSGFTA